MNARARREKSERAVELALVETMQDLAEQTKALAEQAKAIVERRDAWVSQDRSDLGRRKHVELWRAGVLKGFKQGKQIFIRREDIDAYIRSGQAPARRASADRATDDLVKELLER